MPGVVFEHAVEREDLVLGGVWSRGVTPRTPADLAAALTALLAERTGALAPDLERRRKECRDVLRNGVYKPTGRGKPASEYLLRSAREGSFPRINGPVDAANLVSLRTLMPVSLWDVERAGAREFVFRLGSPGQRYVFNPAGHAMDLRDLVCGGVVRDGSWSPTVNPVKDSMPTKTDASTSEVAAAIYAPASAVDDGTLDAACRELAGWLRCCGTENATDARAIVRAGERKTLG